MMTFQSKHCRSMQRSPDRRAMTLIEIILALTLTAMVAGLIGGLMQWYASNQTKATATIEQLRMARALLSMIGDDLRSTARNDKFDPAPLLQLIQSSVTPATGGSGSSGGGSSGGSQTTGDSSGSGDASGGADPSTGGGAPSERSQDSATSGTVADASVPLGIRGSATSIEIDLSKPPRPDEYFSAAPNVLSAALTDLPTDLKTVVYFIQGPSTSGVQDPLASFAGEAAVEVGASAASSGLVRRSVARVVLQEAYTSGSPQRIDATGDLIAKDAVGLSFEYYDGIEWFQAWDATGQGVPIAVRVRLAMQSPAVSPEQRVIPPIDPLTLSPDMMSASGITIYSSLVNIPGAALANAATAGAGAATDDGTAELGL